VKHTRAVSLVLLVFFLGFQGFLAGQEVGSLTGVVTDKTGAVVPDANVTLLDTRTNASYDTGTNSVGVYNFFRLNPGPGYKLSVTREGFASVTISDIYLGVGTTHTPNVELEIGKVSQTVEVSAAGQVVGLNTTDAVIGNNLDMRAVRSLPIEARESPLALLDFQPGVVDTNSSNDPNGSRTGAVTGARGDQGNVTLDGLDVNDFSTGQAFIAVGDAPHGLGGAIFMGAMRQPFPLCPTEDDVLKITSREVTRGDADARLLTSRNVVATSG